MNMELREKPGGLPSMGSHRVGHDWRDLAAAAAFICRVLTAILVAERPILYWILFYVIFFHSDYEEDWVTVIGKNKVKLSKLVLFGTCVNYLMLCRPSDFIICDEVIPCSIFGYSDICSLCTWSLHFCSALWNLLLRDYMRSIYYLPGNI